MRKNLPVSNMQSGPSYMQNVTTDPPNCSLLPRGGWPPHRLFPWAYLAGDQAHC